MAKKPPATQKSRAAKKSAAANTLPENTVVLHLPPELSKKVNALDANLRKHLLRSVFNHDNLFGVTQVLLEPAPPKAAVKAAAPEPKKLCDGPG